MLECDSVNYKKRNYFMTTEEAKILWRYSSFWSEKWRVMVGLALFRGMRISEICPCKIWDFQNDNFSKLNIILAKSHILDEFPILNEFNKVIKNYVVNNRHTIKDGYLFPYYSSKRKKPYITPATATAMFCKLRKIIGKQHKEFLDHTLIKTKTGRIIKKHRISFHTCRRWFETTIWDKYKDQMLLRDIMRYSHSKVVDTYINPYEVWKREGEIINKTFGSLFADFENFDKGQTKLCNWQ